MAETMFIAVGIIAGFFVLFAMNVHGKARAFEHGRDPATPRPHPAATPVDLPAPHFNERAKHQRRSES